MLEASIEESDYHTKSDLVRDAVREKLEKMGFFFRKKKPKGRGESEPN